MRDPWLSHKQMTAIAVLLCTAVACHTARRSGPLTPNPLEISSPRKDAGLRLAPLSPSLALRRLLISTLRASGRNLDGEGCIERCK